MKKIIICIILIVVAASGFGQQESTSGHLSSKDYFKKSKTEKIIGYSLLAAGTFLIIESIPPRSSGNSWDLFAGDLPGNDPAPGPNENYWNTLGFVGLGICLAAEVLLFNAHHHKKQAVLLLKNEKTFFSPKTNIGQFPSVGIKIHL